MRNHRKMIDALLFLEAMCWRLALLMENFLRITGRGLMRFVAGRRGPRLLSHKEIYAANIFKYWQNYGRGRTDCGIYIGRIGRYNSSRNLGIGQS